MKQILLITAIFLSGIAMTNSITAQVIENPRNSVSANDEKVKFNKRGKARTRTTLKSGESIIYLIQRPQTGNANVQVNVKRGARGLNFKKIEWTLKANGESTQSGQLSRTNRFVIKSGDGYYRYELKNLSDKTIKVNLSWIIIES